MHAEPVPGETPVLKLRARNGKELFDREIVTIENQTRPGQGAPRSRCFEVRTPSGSVQLRAGENKGNA